MTPETLRALIIGVGNSYRSDDGAGIVAAQRLREHAPEGVAVIEQSGEGTALLEAWKGASSVILIDAVHSGAPPGTIHRLDAHAAAIPSRFFHYSSHAFSVAEAVELARALGCLPPQLIVYGIEGENFAAGLGLSAAVERAVAGVASRLLDELCALQNGRAVPLP
jgi:hydrogenase maturation protease